MIYLIYPVSIVVGCLLMSLEWNVSKFIKYHALFVLFVIYLVLIIDNTSSAFYWTQSETNLFIVLPLLLSFVSGYVYGIIRKKIELPRE